MALTRLRWLRKALANLDEIATFIAEDSPEDARTFVAGIVAQTERLIDQPNIGRPGRVPGTRELVVANGRYIVPYRVKHGVVEVLRVMHHARRWPTQLR